MALVAFLDVATGYPSFMTRNPALRSAQFSLYQSVEVLHLMPKLRMHSALLSALFPLYTPSCLNDYRNGHFFTCRSRSYSKTWLPGTWSWSWEFFLRPTVSRPVSLGIGPPFGTLDQILSCSSFFV
jgi:hypothetical protein